MWEQPQPLHFCAPVASHEGPAVRGSGGEEIEAKVETIPKETIIRNDLYNFKTIHFKIVSNLKK